DEAVPRQLAQVVARRARRLPHPAPQQRRRRRPLEAQQVQELEPQRMAQRPDRGDVGGGRDLVHDEEGITAKDSLPRLLCKGSTERPGKGAPPSPGRFRSSDQDSSDERSTCFVTKHSITSPTF